MGFWSRWFGAKSKYNDAQIVSQAQAALSADPLISDPSALGVTSQKGVITLDGSVPNAQEKERIEGVVRSALTVMGLKHERIINDLKLPPGAP